MGGHVLKLQSISAVTVQLSAERYEKDAKA